MDRTDRSKFLSAKSVIGHVRMAAVVNCLILSIFIDAQAQDLDQDCRPIPPPAQCQQIVAEIEEREDFFDREINRLTEQRARNESERKKIIAQINDLKRRRAREIARLRNELQQCQQQHNTVPRRQEAASTLDAILSGRVRARTSNGLVPGPFSESVNVGLQFSRNRCTVTITNFPAIVFDTPIGDVEVTQIGGGTGRFFPVSGQMTLPISLKADIPIFADSEASAPLTTESTTSASGTFSLTGSRLTITTGGTLETCGTTVNGTMIDCPLILVGTTVFDGGILGGDEGSIRITGNIRIPQPPAVPSNTRQECLDRCELNYDVCINQYVPPNTNPPNCRALRAACTRRCPNQ